MPLCSFVPPTHLSGFNTNLSASRKILPNLIEFSTFLLHVSKANCLSVYTAAIPALLNVVISLSVSPVLPYPEYLEGKEEIVQCKGYKHSLWGQTA